MEDVGELRKMLHRISDESYSRGWNAAIDAALNAMAAHPIDWMGDRSFLEMEATQRRAIESLRRPGGGNA